MPMHAWPKVWACRCLAGNDCAVSFHLLQARRPVPPPDLIGRHQQPQDFGSCTHCMPRQCRRCYTLNVPWLRSVSICSRLVDLRHQISSTVINSLVLTQLCCSLLYNIFSVCVHMHAPALPAGVVSWIPTTRRGGPWIHGLQPLVSTLEILCFHHTLQHHWNELKLKPVLPALCKPARHTNTCIRYLCRAHSVLSFANGKRLTLSRNGACSNMGLAHGALQASPMWPITCMRWMRLFVPDFRGWR